MSGPPQHALPLPRARPGTALLLDAAGTLLHPSAPVAETYAHHAQRFGVAIDSSRIAARFPAAFAEARPLRRNAPDWRDFWSVVVARSTGCDDPSLVDALVEHFAGPRAWTLAADARTCCEAVRERGMKVAIVSNWDLHLRPLLRAMKVLDWVDLLLVSAEEGLEKPEPALFHRACARLGVEPNRRGDLDQHRRLVDGPPLGEVRREQRLHGGAARQDAPAGGARHIPAGNRRIAPERLTRRTTVIDTSEPRLCRARLLRFKRAARR